LNMMALPHISVSLSVVIWIESFLVNGWVEFHQMPGIHASLF
jgi:hypothetical protein